MTIAELGNDDFNTALIEIQCADILFSIYCLPNGDQRCLYTGVGQKELEMVIQAIHRNNEIYKFIKLAIYIIEQLREDDINNDNFVLSEIEYLNLKKKLRPLTIPRQDIDFNDNIPPTLETDI